MHRDDVICRFGPFALDLKSRRLTRGPDVLQLTDPQFAALEQLVLHAPAFVSKDALAKAGWGGKASDNSIEQVISSLRKVLSHAQGSSAIETERGRGYRLAAPVDRIERQDLLTDDHPDDETIRAFVRTNRELSTLKRDKVLDARRDLEEIVAQVPHYAPARVALATAYALSFEATRFDLECDLGDLPRSVAQAREAISIAPASADAWSSFGFALHLTGDPDDAAMAAWKAVALAPGGWRHFVRLAFVSWGEERIDAAESALILRPDLALAHWQKATVFVARGALDAALAHRQAGCAAQDRQSADAELYPGVGCHLLRGLVLAEQGHLEDAIAEFTRELSGPDYGQIYSRECAANCWYAIGAVRLRQGDLTGADAAFRRGRRMRAGFCPSNPSSRPPPGRRSGARSSPSSGSAQPDRFFQVRSAHSSGSPDATPAQSRSNAGAWCAGSQERAL